MALGWKGGYLLKLGERDRESAKADAKGNSRRFLGVLCGSAVGCSCQRARDGATGRNLAQHQLTWRNIASKSTKQSHRLRPCTKMHENARLSRIVSTEVAGAARIYDSPVSIASCTPLAVSSTAVKIVHIITRLIV